MGWEGKSDRPDLLSHSLVPLLSQKNGALALLSDRKCFSCELIVLDEPSPEKAGVGGSIPSLAAMFSNTYRHCTPGCN
jgi:hypothetical protein